MSVIARSTFLTPNIRLIRVSVNPIRALISVVLFLILPRNEDAAGVIWAGGMCSMRTPAADTTWFVQTTSFGCSRCPSFSVGHSCCYGDAVAGGTTFKQRIQNRRAYLTVSDKADPESLLLLKQHLVLIDAASHAEALTGNTAHLWPALSWYWITRL
jgi:hypothetical protein